MKNLKMAADVEHEEEEDHPDEAEEIKEARF
jgi:hypothetical protein